jgi:hypothetical protein
MVGSKSFLSCPRCLNTAVKVSRVQAGTEDLRYGERPYVGRHLPDGVHLEHRCDGQSYGGCQAGCMMFWKEAWLKPVDEPGGLQPTGDLSRADGSHLDARCTEDDVWRATKHQQPGHETSYCCQATCRAFVERPSSDRRTPVGQSRSLALPHWS